MVRAAKKWAFWLVLSVYLLFGYAMPVLASACLPEVHFSMRPIGNFCHDSQDFSRFAGAPSCACPKTCATKSSAPQLTSTLNVKRLVHSQATGIFFTSPGYASSGSVQSILVPQKEIENATLASLRTVILLI